MLTAYFHSLLTQGILTAHNEFLQRTHFLWQSYTGFSQHFFSSLPSNTLDSYSTHIFSTESLFSLPALKHWIFTVHSFSLSVFWCKHRILTGSSFSLPASKHTGFLQRIQFLCKFPGANIGFSLEAQFLCQPWNTLDSYSVFSFSANFQVQT